MIKAKAVVLIAVLTPGVGVGACSDASPAAPDDTVAVSDGVETSYAAHASRAHPAILPMHATTAGVVAGMEVAPPGRCTPSRPMLASYLGQGNATHMGRITVQGSECLYLDPTDPTAGSSGDGRFVVTAANGDELWIAYEETVLAPAGPGSPWILWSAGVESTGGTGRFENAELVGASWHGGVNLFTYETWSEMDGKIRLR